MFRILLLMIALGLLMAIGVAAEPIHDAAASGDLETVRQLLDRDPALANLPDITESLPLHLAAFNGHLEMVRLLVERGAGVSAGDGDNTTPLICAAMRGHLEIAMFLVEHGASVNERDDYKNTPMLAATRIGSVDLVSYLAEQGASVNERTGHGSTLLHIAISRGHAGLTRHLLQRGVDVNAIPDPIRAPLPLLLAVGSGNTEITRILLEFGADAGYVDESYGRGFLHLTAIRGDSAMAELFLNHGADIGALDNAGKSPLYYAVRYSNPTVARLLRSRGAELDEPESQVRTPDLLWPKIGEKEAVVWYLCHSGWAVKTANHFLIFDYFDAPHNPDIPCLANGGVNQAEIKDLKVAVFSSHEHIDHYASTVFSWQDVIPDITYILGHQPAVGTDYVYAAPRTDHTLDDMRIRTITASDAGVGFLVEVDGLVIFHAGDHANGQIGLHPPYTNEIDYLADLNVPIDLAFLPITGCGLGTPESVREGVIYALEKLTPRVFFPQHLMNVEYRLREFADDLKKNRFTVQIGCAENSGDCFHYRSQQLQ